MLAEVTNAATRNTGSAGYRSRAPHNDQGCSPATPQYSAARLASTSFLSPRSPSRGQALSRSRHPAAPARPPADRPAHRASPRRPSRASRSSQRPTSTATAGPRLCPDRAASLHAGISPRADEFSDDNVSIGPRTLAGLQRLGTRPLPLLPYRACRAAGTTRLYFLVRGLELDHQFSQDPSAVSHLDALRLGPLADLGDVQAARPDVRRPLRVGSWARLPLRAGQRPYGASASRSSWACSPFRSISYPRCRPA